jgi:hypothetical protein
VRVVLSLPQALSNSIWALAHLKSRGMEVDALRHPDLMRFLTELAGAAARALVRPHATLAPPGSNGEPRLPECQRYLALVERDFSCQVRTCNTLLWGGAWLWTVMSDLVFFHAQLEQGYGKCGHCLWAGHQRNLWVGQPRKCILSTILSVLHLI